MAHLAEQEACELRTRLFTAGANHQTDKCSFWVAQPYPHSQSRAWRRNKMKMESQTSVSVVKSGPAASGNGFDF